MKKNLRQLWYDPDLKVSVIMVDVTEAAQTLARNHLCGPTSAAALAEALAAAAALSFEAIEPEESLTIQMACSGPLQGLAVECTSQGILRGFTNRKILEDFDGVEPYDRERVCGTRQLTIARSIPGRILTQGVANSINNYLTQSLQRNAKFTVEVTVTEDVVVHSAIAVLIDALPDSAVNVSELSARGQKGASLAVSERTILSRLGLKNAILKETLPLKFGCRCSRERALATLQTVPPEERASLPESIDVTCHMCGRTYTIHPQKEGL